MNLLMLLSALLSALTGVGAAVRRPELAQAVSQVAAARDVANGSVAAEVRRPVEALPGLRALATSGTVTAFALVPVIAPWTSRRRE